MRKPTGVRRLGQCAAWFALVLLAVHCGSSDAANEPGGDASMVGVGTGGNAGSGGGGAGGGAASDGAAGHDGASASGGSAGSSGAGGAHPSEAGITKEGGGATSDAGTLAEAGADAGARGGCKRGVAYGFDPDGAVQDLTALAPGVTWFYNWSSTAPTKLAGAYAGLDVEYVPMVWGGNFNVDDLIAKIPAGARYLLGFNEPNFNSQANLTPAAAAALWPKLEQVADQRNLALVSPALNYCGGGCNVTNPVDWLDQFFAACTNCRVDYVAIHSYMCDKSALSSYVGLFKKYNKPIWLTEFSCGDSGTQPVSKQESYMTDALAYLEGDPDVFRYAWFSGRTTSIANVDLLGDPGVLTALGTDYVTLPEPAACVASGP